MYTFTLQLFSSGTKQPVHSVYNSCDTRPAVDMGAADQIAVNMLQCRPQLDHVQMLYTATNVPLSCCLTDEIEQH